MISQAEFFTLLGVPYFGRLRRNDSDLPCFAHRISVSDRINTPELIDALIFYASKGSRNDVLVFSVTEQDACWQVWKDYAKANPRKFKVVQGGSIHGKYQCRMYIYRKPKAERKFG